MYDELLFVNDESFFPDDKVEMEGSAGGCRRFPARRFRPLAPVGRFFLANGRSLRATMDGGSKFLVFFLNLTVNRLYSDLNRQRFGAGRRRVFLKVRRLTTVSP